MQIQCSLDAPDYRLARVQLQYSLFIQIQGNIGCWKFAGFEQQFFHPIISYRNIRLNTVQVNFKHSISFIRPCLPVFWSMHFGNTRIFCSDHGQWSYIWIKKPSLQPRTGIWTSMLEHKKTGCILLRRHLSISTLIHKSSGNNYWHSGQSLTGIKLSSV